MSCSAPVKTPTERIVAAIFGRMASVDSGMARADSLLPGTVYRFLQFRGYEPFGKAAYDFALLQPTRAYLEETSWVKKSHDFRVISARPLLFRAGINALRPSLIFTFQAARPLGIGSQARALPPTAPAGDRRDAKQPKGAAPEALETSSCLFSPLVCEPPCILRVCGSGKFCGKPCYRKVFIGKPSPRV